MLSPSIWWPAVALPQETIGKAYWKAEDVVHAWLSWLVSTVEFEFGSVRTAVFSEQLPEWAEKVDGEKTARYVHQDQIGLKR